MTIGEMERYAEGLSDEELWGEIDELSRSWLNENAKLDRPNPPRLVIMLGRELGKRSGLAGMELLDDYFYDLDEEAETLERKGQHTQLLNYLDDLEGQMDAAAFGGYLVRNPDEAIRALLSWWEGYENHSVGGYYETLGDVFRSQMVGAALHRMAATEPDRAFEHLKKAQADLPWSCRGMIGDFFRGIPVGDHDRWVARAKELWPREQAMFTLPFCSLSEVKAIMAENPELRGWEVVNFLKESHLGMIHQLSKDEEVSLRHREDFANHMFYNGYLPVDDILGYPIEIQEEVISDLVFGISAWDDRDFAGPIDGKENTRVQDRRERIGPVKSAVERSGLMRERKEELLEVLEKEKLEMDEEREKVQ